MLEKMQVSIPKVGKPSPGRYCSDLGGHNTRQNSGDLGGRAEKRELKSRWPGQPEAISMLSGADDFGKAPA